MDGEIKKVNLYKTQRWLCTRARVLRNQEYRCAECKKYGKSRTATTVHHKVPASWCENKYPKYLWAKVNLVGLCSSCHNKMHIRDTEELTDLGKSYLKDLGDIGKEYLGIK